MLTPTHYTPMLSRDGLYLLMPNGTFERLERLPRYQPTAQADEKRQHVADLPQPTVAPTPTAAPTPAPTVAPLATVATKPASKE